MQNCQSSKTQVDPLVLAGRVLAVWRGQVGISGRAMARRLEVKQPTWRNVELGVKPPGRVLFIRMILFLKLKKKQILSLSTLYHYHNIGLTAGEKEIEDALDAFDLDHSTLEAGW